MSHSFVRIVPGRALKGTQQPRVKPGEVVVGLDEEDVLFALPQEATVI
jgi:hypothetical protein